MAYLHRLGSGLSRIRLALVIGLVCASLVGWHICQSEQLRHISLTMALSKSSLSSPFANTAKRDTEGELRWPRLGKFIESWSAVDPDKRIFGPKAAAQVDFNKGKAPKRSKPVVPRLVHFVWPKSEKRTAFRFHQLITILAAYKHIKPNEIWFWHEGQIPTGDYWKEMLRKVPNIKLKYRPFPRTIFGRPVNVEEHVSDIVRLESVRRYGGIYLDLDVVAVRNFDPLLYYDTTMGYEVPGGLCNGVIISKPNATFLRKWYENYRTFNDTKWADHSVFLPARMASENPELIHTEADSLHSPGWMRFPRLYYNNSWDWSENYAMHMYYRLYNKDHNRDDIMTLNTTLGRLFRYIYYV